MNLFSKISTVVLVLAVGFFSGLYFESKSNSKIPRNMQTVNIKDFKNNNGGSVSPSFTVFTDTVPRTIKRNIFTKIFKGKKLRQQEERAASQQFPKELNYVPIVELKKKTLR